MKNITINNYTYTPFFNHYFDSSRDWLYKYESPLLDYVKEQLPSNINTIINFGCASGRDFIPFQDDYNCIGFDLASPSTFSLKCLLSNKESKSGSGLNLV